MKVAKKGEYALGTPIDLGLAEEAGRTLVGVSELADKERGLRKHGFVASERGKLGGYRLGKPARTIAVGSVVRAIGESEGILHTLLGDYSI